ncbi:hypothetical protein [Halanaeroarchaeum sulfurireducens]|uniref:hypothetical protein n=1 Tax=Halanaeroarchaeum sulfurireducens TaxID=1604004 RepID=UPI000678E21B|nr:hypothetical protein [Halanaeroarchaeum sulfurireducens]
MGETHSGMHLDVLVEDQFSKFVADGLDPDIVVGAFKRRINLGIDSRDGSVDIYLGNLSADDARRLATALTAAADAIDDESVDEGGQTWVVGTDDDH